MKLLWEYVDGYAQQGHAWINRGKWEGMLKPVEMLRDLL